MEGSREYHKKAHGNLAPSSSGPQLAADRGHTAVVASLLRHGAFVDSQGDDGQTALHCAIVCEFQDVAEQLLKAGANALLPDNDGDTALTLAREMLSSDHPLRDWVEAYAAAVHVKD